jgi:hypothetical protein
MYSDILRELALVPAKVRNRVESRPSEVGFRFGQYRGNRVSETG